jgi:hypothetical protein
MIQIDRETAFRLAATTLPELEELAHQRPEIAPLAYQIRDYLDPSIRNCQAFRDDARAIGELSRALEMAARLLGVPMALARDGGHIGVLASLRTSLVSLAATLLGKTLPNQEPILLSSAMRVAR